MAGPMLSVFPRLCSGDMELGEPRIVPVVVWLPSAPRSACLARPKSLIFGVRRR